MGQLEVHTFDAVIVGAGGAGLGAPREGRVRTANRYPSASVPIPARPRADRRGAGERRRGPPEWHAFDTVKGATISWTRGPP
jgi:succinate dehydrogenase/fumarate reductase flavoprotein subunit